MFAFRGESKTAFKIWPINLPFEKLKNQANKMLVFNYRNSFKILEVKHSKLPSNFNENTSAYLYK
jgi:hypothetical protein